MPARDRALDELGRVARYCRLPEAVWNHDRVLAQIALQEGRLDDAERAWEELAEREGLANLGYVRGLYALHRAAIALARSGTPAARYELWRLLSPWNPGPRADLHLVEFLVDAGRKEEARDQFDDVVKRGFDSLPRDRTFLACLATLAVVAIALDERERAAQLRVMLRPYASFNATDLLVTSRGSVAYYLGLLGQYLGDGEQAREDLQRALEHNRAMGLAPYVARTELALAQSFETPGI